MCCNIAFYVWCVCDIALYVVVLHVVEEEEEEEEEKEEEERRALRHLKQGPNLKGVGKNSLFPPKRDIELVCIFVGLNALPINSFTRLFITNPQFLRYQNCPKKSILK